MSQLATGWTSASLSEIAAIVRGITFPSGEKRPNPGDGYVCCLRTTNVQYSIEWGDVYFVPQSYVKRSEQYVRPGDVLMSMANSYELVGKVARVSVLPHTAAFGAFLAAVRPRAEIDGRFLYHFLRTPIAQAKLREGSSQTTNIANISATSLGLLEMPVAPVKEQQRIADKLDTVLARVDAVNDRLTRVIPLLKRFRQSVLAAATSGRLTADWRCRAEPNWQTLTADEACEKVQSGGTPKAGFAAEGIPFLKVYNIVDQQLDFDYRPQFISPDVHASELKKSQVQPGDVLMNIVGPPLCKVAVVPPDHPQWNINQAITLFRPSDQVSSGWLYIVLCEGQQVRDVLKDTKGSVGQVNISLSQCRSFRLPIPGVDEQSEIVRRVDLLFSFADRLEARLQAAQAAASRLTPALLAKAFRGELVPQDPADEPAAELLRRLAEAQSSPAKKSKSRKAAVVAAS